MSRILGEQLPSILRLLSRYPGTRRRNVTNDLPRTREFKRKGFHFAFLSFSSIQRFGRDACGKFFDLKNAYRKRCGESVLES